MKKVLYPGSFDPITYGHMDIVEQALKCFDKVVIAVLVNEKKSSGLFSFEERKNLIEKIYHDNPNVEVVAFSGNVATVDIATENGCNILIRGIRNLTDSAEEIEMSKINFSISDGNVITLALFEKPGKITISSSMVKGIYNLNKSIKDFVHPIVEEAIKNKLRR